MSGSSAVAMGSGSSVETRGRVLMYPSLIKAEQILICSSTFCQGILMQYLLILAKWFVVWLYVCVCVCVKICCDIRYLEFQSQSVSPSLQKLVRELLSDKSAEEIPIVSDNVIAYPTSALLQLANSLSGVLFRCDEQIVESIIRRVKEEFEHRLETQTKMVSLMRGM